MKIFSGKKLLEISLGKYYDGPMPLKNFSRRYSDGLVLPKNSSWNFFSGLAHQKYLWENFWQQETFWWLCLSKNFNMRFYIKNFPKRNALVAHVTKTFPKNSFVGKAAIKFPSKIVGGITH